MNLRNHLNRLRQEKTWLASSTLLLAACVAAPRHEEPPEPTGTLDGIAAMLVHNAAQRTDIRGVRACLHAFREDEAAPYGHVMTDVDTKSDLVGAELEREFLFALSNRMHVIESEFAAPDAQRLQEAGVDATGAAFKASHLVVGDYYRYENGIVLAVRLVDVETHVILATARATLPFSILSDRARERLILPSERLYRRSVADARPTPRSSPSPTPAWTAREDAVLPATTTSGSTASAAPHRSFAEWRKRPAFEDSRKHRPWRSGPLSSVLRIPAKSHD